MATNETEEVTKEFRSIVAVNFGPGHDMLKVVTTHSPCCPKSDEVRLNVKACGINFADLYTKLGSFQEGHKSKPPFVMGIEAAGIVDVVGAAVTDFKVGDRVVIYSNEAGLWAEMVCVKAKDCWHIPETMSFEDAAAFYVNYVTAYFAVFDFGNLRPNQKIFIHSVAGGVGWAATQLAKTMTDTCVIGTATKWKEEVVRENGVDIFVDADAADYVDKVLTAFPQGLDVVLDNRSGTDFVRGQRLLGPMGKIIHLGANSAIHDDSWNTLRLLKLWWNLKHVPVVDLITRNCAVCGFHLRNLRKQSPDKFKQTVDIVTTLYLQGKLRPRIDSVWTFEQVAEAMKHFSSRKSIGKVVLKPN